MASEVEVTPTPQDISNSKLIGVLLVMSYIMADLMKASKMQDEDARRCEFDKTIEAMGKSIRGLFPDPGQMERETIEFAARLGFEIQLRNISRGSDAKQ